MAVSQKADNVLSAPSRFLSFDARGRDSLFHYSSPLIIESRCFPATQNHPFVHLDHLLHRVLDDGWLFHRKGVAPPCVGRSRPGILSNVQVRVDDCRIMKCAVQAVSSNCPCSSQGPINITARLLCPGASPLASRLIRALPGTSLFNSWKCTK